MIDESRVSTGLEELDTILDGLRIGDNVVWKVDHIDDYLQFVQPYVSWARKNKKNIIYFRFARHRPVIEDLTGINVHVLDPTQGFESFAVAIHQVITYTGRGAFYVFDCLSDLLSAWATDHMIGNFFKITCPYLFDLDTLAYFALIRDAHSLKTIARIRETTQLLLEVYSHDDKLYLHPLKVWQRHSPTMFLPHTKIGKQFIPLANSYEATLLLSHILRKATFQSKQHLDHWQYLFLEAEEMLEQNASESNCKEMVNVICSHMIGREERILGLARKYFSLRDLLEIKSSLIDTGFIGGKAVGMLLAREILREDRAYEWEKYIEPHDSFYVGSNLYYSYIVHNGLWPLFMRQKTSDGYYEAATELYERILNGTFPPDTREEFQRLLEYFGQYPIIVRSSSILEDGFGNAFAGKYDSYFCVNQGSPEERIHGLEDAVKKIYASTMSKDALAYRRQRGLDRQEEIMALLIQRVSGVYRNHYYFPDLAGVGESYNTFVWHKDMDKKAGMLRLVLGLGTRAVDRVARDYPRIVALDNPMKMPHSGLNDTKKYSQKDIDVLDLKENILKSVSLAQLIHEVRDLPMELYGVHDKESMQKLESRGRGYQPYWILTFEKLLTQTIFPNIMQRILKTIEKAYDYPVDIEFTINYDAAGEMKINIVQCRPLQTRGERQQKVEFPPDVAEKSIFIQSSGDFMGGNYSKNITKIVYIEPEPYSKLAVQDKYELARFIGLLNREFTRDEAVMLIGPGRWGTSSPELGIPISFSEINNISVLVEMAFDAGGLIPDISFGSHFFHDLVETSIFYLALFPEESRCTFNRQWLNSRAQDNSSDASIHEKFRDMMKICDLGQSQVKLLADVVSQRILCFG